MNSAKRLLVYAKLSESEMNKSLYFHVTHHTEKLNAILCWYERMFEEFALCPRNKPAPK